MFTKTHEPDPRFNTYYADNALLIQFVITEFIQTFQLIHPILAVPFHPLDRTQLSSDDFSFLMHAMKQLVGPCPQRETASLLYGSTGPLTKLKTHCTQFSLNLSHQNHRYLALHTTAYQTWLAAMHALELMNTYLIRPQQKLSDPSALLPLKRILGALRLRFNQLVRALPRVARDYWNNENVLLCLLRKKIPLMEIYGRDFLYTPFKWPIKPNDLSPWLVKRYRSRGFDALLPTIEQLAHFHEPLP